MAFSHSFKRNRQNTTTPFQTRLGIPSRRSSGIHSSSHGSTARSVAEALKKKGEKEKKAQRSLSAYTVMPSMELASFSAVSVAVSVTVVTKLLRESHMLNIFHPFEPTFSLQFLRPPPCQSALLATPRHSS
jgi:hypothetical protein